MIIRKTQTGPILAKHKINPGKGKLIQDTTHRRDRSKGIDTYIDTVASNFSDKDKAIAYLQEVRKSRKRYIRDQLQRISKQIELHQQELLDLTMEECFRRELFSATDFIDMIQYLDRQRYVTDTAKTRVRPDIKPIHPSSESILQTETFKRDVQEYVSVLEGDL